MSPSPQPVAIVTGASSGIGLAITHQLLSKGYLVAIADINPPTAETLPSLDPSRAVYIPTDVTSFEAQSHLFAETYKMWGRIDVYVSNAGVLDTFDFFGDPQEMVEGVDEVTGGVVLRKPNLRTVDVGLQGMVYGVWLARYYFLKNEMVEKEGEDRIAGRVVVTSSQAGIYAVPVQPMYVGVKHALVGLTRSLGHRKSPYVTHPTHKITINAILPSYVHTPLVPARLVDHWPKEQFTPMSTVIAGFNSFLPGGEKAGESGLTAECTQAEVVYRDQVPYANESSKWCFGDDIVEMVWGKGGE